MLAQINFFRGLAASMLLISGSTIAQSGSANPAQLPDKSTTPACQLLTEKDVLDHIPTKEGVHIAEEKAEQGYSTCVWVRNDLSPGIATEEPFKLTITWDYSDHENDNMGGYAITQARRLGEPVKGLGDEAHWMKGAMPMLVVWYEKQSVAIELIGGEPQRKGSKILASKALLRIKARGAQTN